MIQIKKGNEPDFLHNYVAKNPKATYDSKTFKPYYTKLRKALVGEQKGLCAYCCSEITVDTSHNEHIQPRHMKDGKLSKKSLDYNNIIASCNRVSTCGNHKGNEYDEGKFISPLQGDCESKFSYDPDGYMNGDEYTISLLNLNSYELRNARKAVYRTIMNMGKDDIHVAYFSDENRLSPFSNVIKWFLKIN